MNRQTRYHSVKAWLAPARFRFYFLDYVSFSAHPQLTARIYLNAYTTRTKPIQEARSIHHDSLERAVPPPCVRGYVCDFILFGRRRCTERLEGAEGGRREPTSGNKATPGTHEPARRGLFSFLFCSYVFGKGLNAPYPCLVLWMPVELVSFDQFLSCVLCNASFKGEGI